MAGFYNHAIEGIRSRDFPSLEGITYVDHAGATLYARSQMAAVFEDLTTNVYGNPHSSSASSRLTADSIDQVRFRILKFFNTDTDNYSVIFTSGCTSALKLVAETFSFRTSPKLEQPSSGDAKSSTHFVEREMSTSTVSTKTSPERVCVDASHHLGQGHLVQNTKAKDTNVSVVTLQPDDTQDGKRGFFCYLQDNHTSVQGMRELVADKCQAVFCLTEEEIYSGRKDDCLVFGSIEPDIPEGNCLFAYPAQSNFSGRKYPLEWIPKTQGRDLSFQTGLGGRWFVVLDAASFVATSPLDLSLFKPDFVTVSFYKIFGFPTGLGALLVRNSSAWVLEKRYFGGGTVAASTARERFCALRGNISERFEDGTLPYLDIIALRHGFQTIDTLAGGMSKISSHSFLIAQYFVKNLKSLRHSNGNPLAEIYTVGDFQDIHTQGSIVNFLLRRPNGDFIGFAEIDKLAQLHDIHLRTGCFCNIGACQMFLHISSQAIKDNLNAGHVCGDDKDLINGRPTGSVRISFGYMSSLADAKTCLEFITECFLERGSTEKHIFSYPKWFTASVTADSHSYSSHKKSSLHHLGTQAKDYIKGDYAEQKKSDSSSTEEKSPLSMDYKPVDAKTEAVKVTEECSTDDICSNKPMKLTDIFLYPLKSCGAFKVSEWEIGPRGLIFDRTWMVVSENGVPLGQKREPRLCLLRPVIHLDSRTLELSFPGVTSHYIPLDMEETETVSINDVNVCTNKICNDRVNTWDCGDEVAAWLCETFEKPGLRLLRQLEEDSRKSKRKDLGVGTIESSGLSLANESQFLLISRQSVRSLQRELIKAPVEEGEENATTFIDEENLVQRFRANLVINGRLPFEEDTWTSVICGDVSFTSQGQCSRCGMVCVDQNTGERTKEPLRTLASWKGGKIYFGVYLRTSNLREGQMLKTGSDVLIQ